MKIKIIRLELTNFKCYRHKEFTFNDDVTVIRGRHGLGKTTTADAIFWCLFGKNSMEQHNFSIKTKDDSGQDIPHLDHSVEMTLQVEDDLGKREVTLRRTIKEVWVKKRGSNEQVLKSNTTEYLVNGEALTAKDYEKFISSLVTEEIFRTITNPQYFPSLKWQTQREFILRLSGDVPADDIAGKDEDLRQLTSQLGPDKDIIAHLKHISYQVKKLRERLDSIPIRLEEQNKALPECLDWETVKAEAEAAKAELEKTEAEILAIKSGNGIDIERERIRAEIKAMQQQLDQMYADERNRLQTLYNEQSENIRNLTGKFNNLLTTQRDIETAIPSLEAMARRCRDNAEEQFKSEQAYIREHWPQTQADFASSEATVCPVCHQPLPPDTLAEAEQKFNLHKAELKKSLTDRAEAAKKLLAEAERQAKDYEKQKADKEQELAAVKQQINEVFAQKAQLEKQPVPTAEETLIDNEKYTALIEKKLRLNDHLYNTTLNEDDAQRLADLQAKKEQLAKTLADLNAKLSSKSQYDRIQQLIAGINAEKQQILDQISDLEREEDIARRYQDRQNQVIEERVNKHFQLVRWRMFRTVNNGGEPFNEPYCECYVDGIAYHDGLNQAARLNAGLDIINCLCRHYNVSAPIVIDQSESVLSYLPTEGQQIRLQVADTELQVL